MATLSSIHYFSVKLSRVYFTSGFDGIGKHIKDNIDCEFTDNGIDLRILNFNGGKNYRLKIQPLNDLIDPAASKLKVKSNSLTLELLKINLKKYWTDIKAGKSLTKAADEIDKKKAAGGDEENPAGNLMGLMKELYEGGDDNMKRTIAESWQKASTNKMMGKY